VPVVIVFVVLHFRQRQREQLYETVKHFADRGMPVPRELLDPPRQPRSAVTPRFYAITLIGAGAGLALMFWSLDLLFLLGIGGLVACIGIAQLIAWRLDRNDEERRTARAATAPTVP
jgi:Flp pilus assembly protein TadB